MSPAQKQPRESSRVILVTLAVVLSFIGCYCARLWIDSGPAEPAHNTNQDHHYQRIIALSPSIVEIIYLLGLETQLVGVSRFSNYPPEAKEKPSIGGYVDLHYEKLISLNPDCVILLREQAALAVKLKQLGIHTISICHDDTDGITESIKIIGNELGHPERTNQIVSGIDSSVNKMISEHQNMPDQPRVLISISRDTTADYPAQLIIAGNAGFHRELVQIIGGCNAYQGPVSFPTLSREKLIELNPDVIIDLVNTETWNKLGKQRLLSQWNSYPELKAVKNQRVCIIHGDQHLIPGPRFPQTLEQFARAIHP
ncbi:MAG: ABC transporter substrate-binding protein [Akkermansiaceae bacterium]